MCLEIPYLYLCTKLLLSLFQIMWCNESKEKTVLLDYLIKDPTKITHKELGLGACHELHISFYVTKIPTGLLHKRTV